MASHINAKAKTDMFKFVTKSRAKIQKFTRIVLLDVGARLVYRSPIGDPWMWEPPHWPKGYEPGLFINNWQIGIDAKPTGIIPTVDPTGEASLARLEKLGRWPAGHVYYFVNNLPYANRLEHGWSMQAPYGMVAITELEFPSIVRDAELKAGEA